jgi:hypothetical protein
MTGELAAFMVFVALMFALVGWLLRRGQKAVERAQKDIDELKLGPP